MLSPAPYDLSVVVSSTRILDALVGNQLVRNRFLVFSASFIRADIVCPLVHLRFFCKVSLVGLCFPPKGGLPAPTVQHT